MSSGQVGDQGGEGQEEFSKEVREEASKLLLAAGGRIWSQHCAPCSAPHHHSATRLYIFSSFCILFLFWGADLKDFLAFSKDGYILA